MINHEPDREREQTKADAKETANAYRSIWSRLEASRLEAVRQTELYHDKLACKRAGITQPAKVYGRKQSEIDPAFEAAMQRLWDIGTLPEGRADTELRRPYHLVAKGKAPLTETDVIRIAAMPDTSVAPAAAVAGAPLEPG
jgi:hypothetical protein